MQKLITVLFPKGNPTPTWRKALADSESLPALVSHDMFSHSYRRIIHGSKYNLGSFVMPELPLKTPKRSP